MSPEGTFRHLTIEGSDIVDVSSFYAEINRVFMVGETWQLGETLDGLNDMLHGGYGVLADVPSVTVTWNDIAASREALGPAETRRFLQDRAALRPVFNGKPIADQLEALDAGSGTTYFDIVMEIFAQHPRVRLIAA